MKTEMQIRILKKEDLNDLIELYSHLNPRDTALEPNSIESVWEKTDASGNIEYIGLFIQSQLVSSCQKVVVPNFTRSGHPYCLLENVVTHEEFRNNGYGKKLLKHTIELAWNEGCYKVMLMSGRKEESVMQFYQSVGFSSDEKRAFIIKRDNS